MQRKSLIFETGVSTHVGLVRERNEDSYLVKPEIGVWAVADGMGGHDGGLFASSTVVNALGSIGYPASAPDLLARFEDRVSRANDLLQEAVQQRNGAVMGTTVAGLLAHGLSFTCLWSGDSRVYLLRDGSIVQLTRDHTETQELIDQGALSPEEARSWPGRNVVTRAIGIFEDALTELKHGRLQGGDSFVLCSDGLIGHVEDAEILELASRGSAQMACDRLVELALARGGTDNVTIIIVRCRSADRDADAGMSSGALQ